MDIGFYMHDRQVFTKSVLKNGITLYTHQIDAPVVSLQIQLPVGAAHSHEGNGFLPGSVHFLEHLQLSRSKNFPSAHQLNQELGMRGGHFNGATYRSKTAYWIDVPASELEFACNALIDRVYHPIFNERDLAKERTVVINEREREKFYPGRNLASQYYYTEFMHDMPYSLEQLYGSDEDLASVTVERLQEMHTRIAQSESTVVLAVGPSDFSDLRTQLEKIETIPGLLDRKLSDTHWINKEFRLVSFESITRPTLEVAWIYPRVNQKEVVAISFILGLLTNYVHGTLYHEFRQEKGWIYSLDHFLTNHKQTFFGLTFPVNSIEQIQYIRDVLTDRIRAAVMDQQTVENEVRRRLNNQVYNYQTVASIMNSASSTLISNKKIMTEADWQNAVEAMRDKSYRLAILDHFFQPEHMGELGFTPA